MNRRRLVITVILVLALAALTLVVLLHHPKSTRVACTRPAASAAGLAHGFCRRAG